MAELLEDENFSVEDTTVDTTQQESTEAEVVEAKPDEPELPEKLKGKTVADIFKMYEESEKALSRKNNEVHEVRQLADELLKSQFKKPEVEQTQEVDFFENPQEAIRRAVESNPKVLAAEQYSQEARKMANRQRLMQAHPDFNEVVNENFIEWVKQSPVRTKLFKDADENFDFDSGNELLSTYKQINAIGVKKPEVKISEVEKDAIRKAATAASVDTGGTNESSKKIFRRTDLMKLKMRDPAQYEARQDEIALAYEEGRVR